MGPASADFPLCRARGGGEEYRRLPRSRSAGFEGRGRRRSDSVASAAEYPNVLFTGPLRGAALAHAYAGADVFVFPSLTDTFGLVMLEALACGTPVAAFPVTGPIDVLAGRRRQDRCASMRSARRGAGGAGRRPRRLPGPCRTLFVARLRGGLPVSPGAAGGGASVHPRHNGPSEFDWVPAYAGMTDRRS